MKLLALISLLLIGATAQAATIEIGTPSYIRPVGDQLYYFPADERAPPRVAWPGMENNSRDINVPTSKGRLPVTVNQKTPVAINKLGKAATNLAKRVGPVALGLGVAGLLCDLTDICSTPSDPENPASEPIFTKHSPDNKPMTYQRWRTNYNSPSVVPIKEFDTHTAACDYVAPLVINYLIRPELGAYVSGEFESCELNSPEISVVKLRMRFPNLQYTTVTANSSGRIQGCPSTHYEDGNMCRPKTPTRVPLTPGDWDTAGDEPGLNTPDIIPDLIEGGEPIPVDTPSIDPKTTPGPAGSTTETIRNGAGEPIGTKTTDTTVTVTPSGPTTVNVTETTTITETNITNNTTTTTVQDTTLPNNENQSEPEKDQDLEIDNVEDQDLDTHEIPDTFTYDSWGGGSCPGDPSISAMGRSYTLPVHTVCEAITDMRPAVLLIAALVSAFIISGAFRQ